MAYCYECHHFRFGFIRKNNNRNERVKKIDCLDQLLLLNENTIEMFYKKHSNNRFVIEFSPFCTKRDNSLSVSNMIKKIDDLSCADNYNVEKRKKRKYRDPITELIEKALNEAYRRLKGNGEEKN